MGKPVVQLSSEQGYPLWAASYDRDPNPLLALEQRFAAPILGPLAGLRVVDVCAGTGRWTSFARRNGANAIGFDLAPAMIHRAAAKPECAGRVAIGDILRIPIRSAWADVAICSFALSYVPSIGEAFCEMARIARRVMVSDMHPAAACAGWSRSFETSFLSFQLSHCVHSFDQLEAAARVAGLKPERTVDPHFGEAEREIFVAAGKERLLERVSRIPAIYIKTWVKQC